MAKLSALLILACWFGAIAPANADPANTTTTIPIDRQVEEVASRLEGIMDTSVQAANHSKAPNVRMTTCRVQLEGLASLQNAATVLLYQEQALSSNLLKPYRQRFLKISPNAYSQSVQSLSFKLTDPAALIGLCAQPEATRRLKPNELGQLILQCFFLRRAGTTYIGSTPVDGCPANIRGAVRITNRIVLHEFGMDTWDRGFDAQGKQVWGAQSESYQFRRISVQK